jgi:hypothetical protein
MITNIRPDDVHECPQCHGEGKIYGFHPVKVKRLFDSGRIKRRKPGRPPKFKTPTLICDLCRGSGIVNGFVLKLRAAGQLMRSQRVALGRTLRDEARRLGIDPARLSRIERGVE